MSESAATMTKKSSLRHTNSRCKHLRQIDFGNVTVYEFDQVLGDNPAVSQGAPLTLGGFKAISRTTLDVDFYEYVRIPKRRSVKDLIVPRGERELHLLEMGYNFDEICFAAKEASKTRARRIESFQNKKWDGFNVVVEKTMSKMKKLVVNKTISYEEKTSPITAQSA